MEINRSNYEIWLIDLLDGNLSTEDAEQVAIFLELNPDLREEFNDLLSLTPELNKPVFKKKNISLKTSSDIPQSQFELLCAAFHEGDLNPESEAELMEIINSDHEKKRIFDLTGKAKVLPYSYVFKGKSKIIRITPFRRVMRFTMIGLSTAAAVALLVTISSVAMRSAKYKTDNSAENIPVYPDLKNKYFEITARRAIRVNQPEKIINENRAQHVAAFYSNLPVTDTTKIITSEIASRDINVTPITAILINLTADLTPDMNTDPSLRSFKTSQNANNEEIYMSNVERFVTKIFREKILKEKVTHDTPLKGYEIAEAGVEGLNKILGWEMALNEKNDENGDLKSVYFSSKILKFNTPVKKYASRE